MESHEDVQLDIKPRRKRKARELLQEDPDESTALSVQSKFLELKEIQKLRRAVDPGLDLVSLQQEQSRAVLNKPRVEETQKKVTILDQLKSDPIFSA